MEIAHSKRPSNIETLPEKKELVGVSHVSATQNRIAIRKRLKYTWKINGENGKKVTAKKNYEIIISSFCFNLQPQKNNIKKLTTVKFFTSLEFS